MSNLHDDDTCPHLVRASLLETENARLKAEVERLTWLQVEALNERNKAEADVERLDTLCKKLGKQHSDISCENIMLRKAGDELHHFLINYIVETRVSSAYLNKLDDDWTAAKEGKPSV